MKLKQLSIAGFRGFNSQQTIDFDSRLTLISANNSYGKTSITEALEFLLYGETSKVEYADSKEEYRGSYLNKHYPAGMVSFVEAICSDPSGTESTLRVEFDGLDNSHRFLNGAPISEWPFANDIISSARPFVVQHALKALLLAAPADRFQGFARLLGLNDVDTVQQALVNLCTKPEAGISNRVKASIAELEAMEIRLAAYPSLQQVTKEFKKGAKQAQQAYSKAAVRGTTLVADAPLSNEPLLTHMIAARDSAATRVYPGKIDIRSLNAAEEKREAGYLSTITNLDSAGFINSYAGMGAQDALQRIQRLAEFMTLGVTMLGETPEACPFCGQSVDTAVTSNITHRCDKAISESDPNYVDPRKYWLTELPKIKTAIGDHCKLLSSLVGDTVATQTQSNAQILATLFGKSSPSSLNEVNSVAKLADEHQKTLSLTAQSASEAIAACVVAINESAEEIADAEAVITETHRYIAATKSYLTFLSDNKSRLSAPALLLAQQVDEEAGTLELSLLIDLFTARSRIEKALRLRDLLLSLKELKKQVDQAMGQVMEEAFSQELTGSVMTWYKMIRTTGDPNVHFSGFSMERTKAGDFKNRRVRVSAESYGVELASAVSSLSESKLNALGLCMSIATAVRAPGPWGFLVMDDPIQSWDEDHEIRFVDIIRSLVTDEDKQLILLSHRNSWIDVVAEGCRTQNGIRYRISGYTQDGPHLQTIEWAQVDDRLRAVLSVANNKQATLVQLQQAEEEIRLAACQLAAQLSKTRLQRKTNASTLNSKGVRVIMNDAGCPSVLTDKVCATFGTTDDAHHAPVDYQPNAERIRQYYDVLLQLKQWMTN